jgi:hypothetical protein
MHTEIWWGNVKERGNSEDLGVDGKLLFKIDIKEIGQEGVDWIHLAQVEGQERVLVVNLQVPQNGWNILSS